MTCNPGGFLYFPKDYKNFVLRLEFRVPEGGNNGIGIRCEPGKDAAYHGMELQILDDYAEKYKGLQPYQFCGSIYGVVPVKRGATKPAGEWNCEEVVADGGKIRVTINGQVVVDADISQIEKTMDGREHPGLHNPSGAIAFCGHGDRVESATFASRNFPDAIEKWYSRRFLRKSPGVLRCTESSMQNLFNGF